MRRMTWEGGCARYSPCEQQAERTKVLESGELHERVRDVEPHRRRESDVQSGDPISQRAGQRVLRRGREA